MEKFDPAANGRVTAQAKRDWGPEETTVRRCLEEICSAERPRFWERETETAKYVENALADMGVPFTAETYDVEVPRWDAWGLTCDGRPVDCLPCCLVGGRLDGASVVDAISVQDWDERPAIMVNPHCTTPAVAWLSEKGPAVAVSPADADILRRGGKTEGFVDVSRYQLRGRNIVVGDPEKCEKLVVCHYDSYWGGAMDNGVGVATMLALAPKLRDARYCLLFGGTEEASFETPYWCAGYRAFERAHPACFKNAAEIVVLNSFGHRENVVRTGENAAVAAFKVAWEGAAEKLKLYSSSRAALLSNYQTRADMPDKIDALDLDEVWRLITG